MISCATSDDIREGTKQLFFTEHRVFDIVQPELQSLAAEVKGLLSTQDQDLTKQAEVLSIHASRVSALEDRTSDDIVEGAFHKFFSDDRVTGSAAVLSVGKRVDDIQQSLARVPTDKLWTQTEGMNWFAERTLDDISDGTERRLMTVDDLETRLPNSTDDIAEGKQNKYLTSDRVVDVLRQTSVDVMLNGDASYSRDRVERVVSELAPSLMSPLRDEIETMAISCASMTADLQLLSERVQTREQTTLDHVPDGTERKLLLKEDVESMLETLRLDDVTETDAFLHFKVEDKARLDDVLHRIDAAHSSLKSHNVRLEGTEIETARVTSALQTLTTASIPEDGSLYFTSERAKAAVLCDINTAVVPEAEGFWYFSTDRCLSVCMPALSRYEEETTNSLQTIRSTVADLKLHDVETKHELDELRERADGLSARLSAAERLDLLQSTTITELQTDQRQLQEEHQHLTLELTHVITRDQFNEDLRVYSDRIQSVEQWVQQVQKSSTTLSDDRLKHGESPLSDALSVVTALVPLHTRWCYYKCRRF